jgi:hypothetical protein
MMLTYLVLEFTSVRRPGWLVMSDDELGQYGLEAVRYYAGWGDIKSISHSDVLPGAGVTFTPADPPAELVPSLPIKDLALITEAIDLSVGEWAVIRPLFVLYVERENALRLEASRASGLEVYGRSVSEITSDIARMEDEILPQRAFSYVTETVS